MRSSKVLLAACLLSGCAGRVKPADEQTQGQVEIPAAELAADALAFARPAAFKGSAVIFAESATPRQIARIADAARLSREAKTGWVQIKRDEVRPLAARQLQLTAEVRSTEATARADRSTRAAQEAVAHSWIESQWAALDQARVLKDDGRAEAVFARYCEAKVWELAVSPLASRRYTVRPSPLVLCEPVLEAKGLFRGPACAASGQGRSYFACLWKEGVMKTSFFVGRYESAFAQSPDEKKATKITAWVDDGTLAEVLSSDKAPKLVNAALGMDRLRVGSVLGANYKDAFVPDQGTPVEAPELALADAAPLMLISAAEDGEKPTTAASLLFAKREDLDRAGQAALLALHQDLQAMAQRSSLESSASDFLFNHPTAPVAEPAQVTTVKTRASFRPIFDALAPSFKEKLASLGKDLAAVTQRLDDRTLAADARFAAYTNALREGAIAASEGGATDALWISVKLQIDQVESGILRVSFQLDEVNTRAAEVCVDAASKAEIDCPAPRDGQPRDVLKGHVEHDPATGLLAFEMTLDRPEPFGFTLTAPPPPGSGNPFSLIDPSSLENARLRLELYPARSGGLLDFYSGKLLIRGPGADGLTSLLHEGATNLMVD